MFDASATRRLIVGARGPVVGCGLLTPLAGPFALKFVPQFRPKRPVSSNPQLGHIAIHACIPLVQDRNPESTELGEIDNGREIFEKQTGVAENPFDEVNLNARINVAIGRIYSQWMESVAGASGEIEDSKIMAFLRDSSMRMPADISKPFNPNRTSKNLKAG